MDRLSNRIMAGNGHFLNTRAQLHRFTSLLGMLFYHENAMRLNDWGGGGRRRWICVFYVYNLIVNQTFMSSLAVNPSCHLTRCKKMKLGVRMYGKFFRKLKVNALRPDIPATQAALPRCLGFTRLACWVKSSSGGQRNFLHIHQRTQPYM
jgi:hypothetical protein